MKTCSHCKTEKDLGDFYASHSSRDGKQHKCKLCSRLSNQAWRASAKSRDAGIPPLSKKCIKCGETKLVSGFPKDKYRPHGISDRCKRCGCDATRDSLAARKANDPVAYVEYVRAANLKRQYGIEKPEYDRMFEACGGECEICGGTNGDKPLYVDHCHSTGRVRGLLCGNCNTALGMLKEDVEIIRSMIVYIKERRSHAAPSSPE